MSIIWNYPKNIENALAGRMRPACFRPQLYNHLSTQIKQWPSLKLSLQSARSSLKNHGLAGPTGLCKFGIRCQQISKCTERFLTPLSISYMVRIVIAFSDVRESFSLAPR